MYLFDILHNIKNNMKMKPSTFFAGTYFIFVYTNFLYINCLIIIKK